MKHSIEKATIIYLEFENKVESGIFRAWRKEQDIEYLRILVFGGNYFEVLVDDANAKKLINYIKAGKTA